jgi:hypothetical protein
MFIPDPNFSIPDPRSRVKKIPDPGFGYASKNLIFLAQKIVSKLSEKLSGMFIPDPDLVFFSSRIPDTGSKGKKAQDPRSGFATLFSTYGIN